MSKDVKLSWDQVDNIKHSWERDIEKAKNEIRYKQGLISMLNEVINETNGDEG